MTQPAADVLAPCPFCDERPDEIVKTINETYRFTHRCKVIGPITVENYGTAEDVAKTWNTRAASQPQAPQPFDVSAELLKLCCHRFENVGNQGRQECSKCGESRYTNATLAKHPQATVSDGEVAQSLIDVWETDPTAAPEDMRRRMASLVAAHREAAVRQSLQTDKLYAFCEELEGELKNAEMDKWETLPCVVNGPWRKQLQEALAPREAGSDE